MQTREEYRVFMDNQACILDIGNTLLNFFRTEKKDLFYLFSEPVLSKDNSVSLTASKYHFAAQITELYYQNNYTELLTNEKSFWEKYYQIGLLSMGYSFDKAIQLGYEIMNQPPLLPEYSLIDGAIEMIIKLTEEEFQLVAMSNWDGSLNQVLSDLGIRKYFHQVFDSAEVGLNKPNIDFFDMVIQNTGIDISSSYFLGDSLYTDIFPAQQVGLFPILYDSLNVLGALYEGVRITSLNQFYNTICRHNGKKYECTNN